MARKTSEPIVIPQRIVRAVTNLNLIPNEERYAYAIVDDLTRKAVYKTQDGWLRLNHTYLELAYGQVGARVLRKLTKAGVIEMTKDYCVPSDGNAGFPKGYRVNRDLLVYTESAVVQAANQQTAPAEEDCSFDSKNVVVANLQRLTLDFDAAIAHAARRAASITLDKYLVDEQINQDYIEVYDARTNNTWWWSFADAMVKSRKMGKQLIMSKRIGAKAHLVNSAAQFVEDRKTYCYATWTRTLTRMRSGVYRATRNKTNTRLDSEITSLPKDFFQFITVDGGEVHGVDIANAQFAILAALLRNPTAFKAPNAAFFASVELDEQTHAFIDAASTGDFYERLMQLFVTNRDKAKTMAFACIFSSANTRTEAKALLRQQFPQLVKITDDFKRQFGDKQLAILLQTIEAEIVLDKVVPYLIAEGLWFVSKHDSIQCRPADLPRVTTIMQSVLAAYAVVCTLRAENITNKNGEVTAPIVTVESFGLRSQDDFFDADDLKALVPEPDKLLVASVEQIPLALRASRARSGLNPFQQDIPVEELAKALAWEKQR